MTPDMDYGEVPLKDVPTARVLDFLSARHVGTDIGDAIDRVAGFVEIFLVEKDSE